MPVTAQIGGELRHDNNVADALADGLLAPGAEVLLARLVGLNCHDVFVSKGHTTTRRIPSR